MWESFAVWLSVCGPGSINVQRKTHVLNLVSVEPRDQLHYDEGQRAAEVDNLVHNEAQNSRRQCVVLHPEIPGRPEALSNVELDIVLGDLLKNTGEGNGQVKTGYGRVSVGARESDMSGGPCVTGRKWRVWTATLGIGWHRERSEEVTYIRADAMMRSTDK
jgi:hypothetical protein